MDKLSGYSGILFLVHQTTKETTIKWYGPEVKGFEKALTEKALLTLFKGQKLIYFDTIIAGISYI